MRTLTAVEIQRFGRFGQRSPAWLLVCVYRIAGNHYRRAARMRDHETPGVNWINSLSPAAKKGFLMRTQALVLVLIVIAASEPARLFRAIINGIIVLLLHIKLL